MTWIVPLPVFTDNYVWLVLDGAPLAAAGTLAQTIQAAGARHCAVVDPGDGPATVALLEQAQLQPCAILVTHHDRDHVAGIPELTARWRCPVYGPAGDQPGTVTHVVDEGDRIHLPAKLGDFTVLTTPGHTAHHVAYLGDNRLFCGDTLFGAGCGRVKYSTALALFQSLEKLAQLPTTTEVYCAHEYTLANLRFAQYVEPDNLALRERWQQVCRLREIGQPSLPSTLGLELDSNPFLRCAVPQVRAAVERFSGRALQSKAEVFAELRRWKDNFRP
jgi:hydroxyacylglutathione hydrolase